MNPHEKKIRAITIAPLVLSALTAAAGVARFFALDEKLLNRLDITTLVYFGVAGAMLLLPRVKSLSFGDYKLEVQDIADKANEALEEAKTASSMAQLLSAEQPSSEPETGADAPGAGKPTMQVPAKQIISSFNSTIDRWDRKSGSVADDPWKGVFGDKNVANNRRLRAEVVPVSGDEGWYRIRLWVESVDDKRYPLKDRVRFFIHDSFLRNKSYVAVVNNRAELRLKAWGAFTVGALADDGKTELELDLSEDHSFPRKFRER